MTGGKIRLERKRKIALATIDRVSKKNAFDESMFPALEKVSEELKDNLPRAVIITGSGNETFCTGFDINPEP